MSDDLIARLINLAELGHGAAADAADRIEKLEVELAAAKAGRVTVKPLLKPLAEFGVRELARAAGISPTTAHRVKRGETDLDGATMRAVMSVTGQCLCCGHNLLSPTPVNASPAPDPVVKDVTVAEAARVLLVHIEANGLWLPTEKMSVISKSQLRAITEASHE